MANPCTLLPQPHHLTNGGLANVSTVYRAAGRKLPATWGKRAYADAGRTHPSSSATYNGPLPRRKQERPELAAQTAVTGHRGSFSCKQVGPRRGAALTLTRLVENKEKREVMADNFLIVVYYPHPGTRKPTIFGDFRFPNYPLFDNFHCRLLLRCPVLSSHHRLSMSLPLQHHTQMLRRYH